MRRPLARTAAREGRADGKKDRDGEEEEKGEGRASEAATDEGCFSRPNGGRTGMGRERGEGEAVLSFVRSRAALAASFCRRTSAEED